MQNVELARVFDELADYLELAGENQFKIRAYRKASDAIVDYPGDIQRAADDGQLDEIEGLGAATIAKSREFLATGKVKLLEFHRSQHPAGLLDVLHVPGLGPKKVVMLYKERGIDSIEKFTEALENGGLNGLSGFGSKTIENLKINIKRMAELTARLPLLDAVAVAERLKTALIEKFPALEIHDAGSLRRGCDTLGDLNFVVKSADKKVLDEFVKLPHVVELIERTESGAKARVHPGIEVEIILAPLERFGSKLFFHTGSKSHVEGKELGDFADEAAVYAHLGSPFIEPELREGKGEWEAAKAGKLPKLLVESDIKGDIHTHSTWSDGSAGIAQMAQAVTDRGYQYFAVTDHSKALAMANGLNADRLREQAKEIAEVQEQFPNLKIFRGIECDILKDGSMDLDNEILSELDIVVASVHSAFTLDEATQTDRIISAIANPYVTFIGHPTGRILGQRAPYDVDVSALIEAAAHFGKALEINASERLDLKDEHAFLARKSGVLLSIDTDAHSPRMLSNLHFGVTTARRAWCEKKDILNAKTLDELNQWLSRTK